MSGATNQSNEPGTDTALAPFVIVDLSRVLAGPFCTMQLADLGAEVIKVEALGHGDDARGWGPPFRGGESVYFLCANRNKRSITIDLKAPRGKALLWRLLERADVLIENFRPGTMERLGFAHGAVSARLPRLVYCSISAFGQTGPDRDLPGYDVLLQGESGLMSLTGDEGGPPYKLGVPISDLAAGMAAVSGILAALLERERTGKGRHVDISLLEVSASLLTFQLGIYYATGQLPHRYGNAHATIAPYSTYPTADGMVILAVGNDNIFVRFCEAVGRKELPADPRFATIALRVQNRALLDPILADVLSRQPRDHWIALLRDKGVPCGAVRDMSEVAASAQLAARGMVNEVEHPTAGQLHLMGSPLRLDGQPSKVRRPPPRLGEHTDQILLELGLPADEIAELHRDKVV